ncbi:hypothetical protein TNCV_921431 [Trichonephila clavipes]|nr:hypothetical protein TNCV_921431 [Trichonephila clavipes]
MENMLSMVAQRLTQITPLAATPDQLWQRVEAAWSAVPQEHIQILHIMKAMNLEIGSNSYEMCLKIDKHSIKLAERSLSDRVKEARIASSRKEMPQLEGQLHGVGISD